MSFDATVLVSLGSPRDFSEESCRDFLREFLSDRAVVPLPDLLRNFLAKRVAKKRAGRFLEMLKLCSRNSKTQSAYYLDNICSALNRKTGVKTYWAGVCGSPKVSDIVGKIRPMGDLSGILFIVLYPQCASATTEPAVAAIEAAMRGRGPYKIVKEYCREPFYLDGICDSVRKYTSAAECILVSFHGIPKNSLNCDSYIDDCKSTTAAIREAFPDREVLMAWQSVMRFGRWTSPKVIDVVASLLKRKVKKLALVCPGFFCDCTETTLEIDRDLRKFFLENGGEKFEYVPCLNDSDTQIEILEKLYRANI